MIAFFFKKFLVMLMTLLLVSACIFLVFALIPGDPALRKLGTEGTPQQLYRLRQEMGLLKPLSQRYAEWLFSLVHGDMGRSYFYDEPVGGLIAEKLPLTGFLSLFAFGMTVLFSLPVGILCARFENGWLDQSMMVLSQLFMAIFGTFWTRFALVCSRRLCLLSGECHRLSGIFDFACFYPGPS